MATFDPTKTVKICQNPTNQYKCATLAEQGVRVAIMIQSSKQIHSLFDAQKVRMGERGFDLKTNLYLACSTNTPMICIDMCDYLVRLTTR